MSDTKLTDAARLAASLPLGVAASPRDVELGPAWLDLRGQPADVALARCDGVGVALRACLSLQEAAVLFVTTGRLSPEAVASRLAVAALADGSSVVRIATLRGEDVSDRLEEFLVAGADLSDPDDPKRTVVTESRPLLSAIAVTPPSELSSAVESGASIVVSRSADRQTIEQVVNPRRIDQDDDLVAVELQFAAGWEVTAAASGPLPSDEPAQRITSILPAGVRSSISPCSDGAWIHLSAARRDEIDDACRRCELLLDGLGSRLIDQVRPTSDGWTARVPAHLLEFGHDLRPASEWIDRDVTGGNA